MQEFQIPAPVVEQWQQQLAEEDASEQEEEEALAAAATSPRRETSDSDYNPSRQSTSASSACTPSPKSILRRHESLPTGKRAQVATPDERKEIAGLWSISTAKQCL
ncbi:hypothetical protein V7S43_011073 [Phytophthora oleae]|uniref:Uncharacterized protein n=1 Tax=Phytophthora oleae TaxID=2107226 RepID=A0ABD3FA98_9STRA